MTAIAHRAKDVSSSPPVSIDELSAAPLATLSADLLPDEILVKRRLGYLKRRLVFVMIALVALVVLGDLLVRQQTSSASDGLAGADNQIAHLNKQVDHFNGILGVQSETQAIWTQLDGAMADDVAWPALLNRLVRPAPAGVHVTSIDATVDAASALTTSTTGTGPEIANQVGTLTLTGSAPNWRSVATYVHRLSAVKGFAAVNPSTVANGTGTVGGSGSGLTFTITLDLTNGVLSNRYASTGPSSTSTTTTATATTTTATTNAPADRQSTVPSATHRHTSPSKTKASGSHSRRHKPHKKAPRRHRQRTTGTGSSNGSIQTSQETS